MNALSLPVVLVACVAALAAGRALAEPGGGPGMQSRTDFLALDRNRDGAISRVEALGDREVAKRFAEFDRDKDSHLDEAEYVLARDDIRKRILSDALITARVKATLLAHRDIPSMSIGVDTYEGTVQLSGRVASPEIVSKAGRLTRTVDGVRTVDNNIAVR